MRSSIWTTRLVLPPLWSNREKDHSHRWRHTWKMETKHRPSTDDDGVKQCFVLTKITSKRVPGYIWTRKRIPYHTEIQNMIFVRVRCVEFDWAGLVWVEVLFAITLINTVISQNRNAILCGGWMKLIQYWLELLVWLNLIVCFRRRYGNQTPAIDGHGDPWMATGKAKNKSKSNEQTRTTEVTYNRLATHQHKPDIFNKTEKKESKTKTAETTRDSNGTYIHLADRVVTCFNDLLVSSTCPTIFFFVDATENSKGGGVAAEMCGSQTGLWTITGQHIIYCSYLTHQNEVTFVGGISQRPKIELFLFNGLFRIRGPISAWEGGREGGREVLINEEARVAAS